MDVALDIAGVGSRSYAFVIDWNIRLLLALGWFCGAWLVIRGWRVALPSTDAAPRSFWAIALVPSWVIYLLYHPLLEVVMRGRTPGKRRAGVRIVTRQGGTPGVGALLIRNIFRLVDSLPFFYLVGLASCFITEQRVRIGDLAAGTLLVIDAESAARTLAQLGSMVAVSGLPPALVELVHDLLERWSVLAIDRRDELARALLARADPSATAAQLASLSDADLSRRLRQLLSGVATERS